MKLLRTSALILALGSSILAQAQQEVDPDHFDQPIMASTHPPSSKMHTHPIAMAAHRQTRKRVAATSTHKRQQQQNARLVSGGLSMATLPQAN